MCSRPLLTLCMIIRNEENNLPRSLAGVQDLVDEIIVVDTGSEDNSVEIARRYGAQVYFFQWQNDFALARNFALEKARGEWVLVLDADEEIKSKNQDLRDILRQSDKEGYFCKIINLEDNQNHLYSAALRLFRNHPHYRYEGKLHEQIIPAIQRVNPSASFDWLSLEIYHYGYLISQIKAKHKEKRNLEILLNEDPEVKITSFYCLNLGVEYLRIGDYPEAEKWFKEGWQKVEKRISFAHRLISKLVTCLVLQGKFEEAVFYSREGERHFPDYADLYYYHGVSLIELGRFREAREVLLKGLEKGASPNFYISEAGSGTYRNLEALGILEEAHLNTDLAVKYFLEALRLQPHDSYYLKLLLKNLLKSSFNQESFLKSLAFIPDEVLQAGGEFLFNLGRYNLVNEILELKKHKELDLPETLLRAKVFLMLGKISSSLELLEKIPANNQLRKEAVFYTWIALWLQGNTVLAGDYCQEIFYLDSELGNLLEKLHKYLFYGSLEESEFSGLNQENNIMYLLSILEIFARVLGASELLARMQTFTQKIGGERALVVAAKILYKQNLYSQSYEILKKTKIEEMDPEALLALVELTGNSQTAAAGKILNYIMSQGPPAARVYLMGIDLWLGAAGKVNSETQEKTAKLKKIPPIC